MIPKTVLRYPWIYSVVLNGVDWKYAYTKHKKYIAKCKLFETVYNKNIFDSLRLIEKHSKNKKWAFEFIPINIVFIKKKLYKKIPSFSNPLTLKYRKDYKQMFYILVHELVHNNLDHDMQVKLGHKKREKLVWSITDKVWQDLTFGPFPKKLAKTKRRN